MTPGDEDTNLMINFMFCCCSWSCSWCICPKTRPDLTHSRALPRAGAANANNATVREIWRLQVVGHRTITCCVRSSRERMMLLVPGKWKCSVSNLLRLNWCRFWSRYCCCPDQYVAFEKNWIEIRWKHISFLLHWRQLAIPSWFILQFPPLLSSQRSTFSLELCPSLLRIVCLDIMINHRQYTIKYH